MAESKLETLGDRFTPTQQTLFDFLSGCPERLRTDEDISEAVGRELSPLAKRAHFRNIRPKIQGEGYIYAVLEKGYFYSPSPPETLEERVEQGEITLSSLGLSPVAPEEERRIRRNHPTNHPKILRLMKRLDFEQKGESAPYLKPHLSPPEQGLLKCLAQTNEFGSREELMEAAGIDKSQSEGPSDLLRQHISLLRDKLPETIEIIGKIRRGWRLGQELTPRERVPKRAADLLAFMEARSGRCVKYEEIFRNVFGYDLDCLPEANRELLNAHSSITRRHLGKGWQLAAVRGYEKIILFQGKLGDKVELPGLCDFSGVPENVKKILALLLEKGILGKKGIKAAYTPTESSILLELAERPEEVISRPVLEKIIWERVIYKKYFSPLYPNIYQIRKKLKRSGVNMRIEYYRNQGYKLVLGNSQS